MKINLITSDEHTILKSIQSECKILTLQNKDYEGIDRTKFTDEEKKIDTEVNTILKKSIYGFSRFQNFKLTESGEIRLRFQYNYNYNGELTFIGVGYIMLDELLNGFDY